MDDGCRNGRPTRGPAPCPRGGGRVGCDAASSAQVIERSGAPRTAEPPLGRRLEVSDVGLEQMGGERRAFSATFAACSTTADPPAWSEREPHVPCAPRNHAGVAMHHPDDSNGTPSTADVDLCERGLVALSVRGDVR